MATVNDFGDELPPDNKTESSTGHVEDHNRISRELAEVQDVVKQLAAAYPNIRGKVSQESQLPTPGGLGDMYIVGEADLYAWDQANNRWNGVGNFKGEQGLTGAPGTVVGKLAYGATPPGGTLSGTLWWVADQGTSPPAPSTTPALIGAIGDVVHSGQTATVSAPGGGVTTGDIGIMAFMHASETRTISISGWTEITAKRQAMSNSTMSLFYRVMQTGDSTFTATQSGDASYLTKAWSMFVVRNVVLTGGTDVQQSNWDAFGSTSGTQACPTVTPTSNAITISWWCERVTYTAADIGITAPSPLVAYGIGSGTPLTGGSLNDGGTGVRVNIAGAIDINYYSSGARPTGSPNWVRTGTDSISTNNGGMLTIALTKAT